MTTIFEASDNEGMGYRIEEVGGKFQWVFFGDGEPDLYSDITFDTFQQAARDAIRDWEETGQVSGDEFMEKLLEASK